MSVIIDMTVSQEVLDSLNKNNIQYFLSCKHPNLLGSISTHPDMQIHFIDEKLTEQLFKFMGGIHCSAAEII